MKSLIVYSSNTGNTRKLAEAVFDALPEAKEIYAVEAAPDPSQYDFIAVGFWLKGGQPDAKSAEYLGRVGKKPLFLFGTHGAAAGSNHADQGMQSAKSLVSEADIRGTYSCQGEVTPKVLEKARSKPQPPVWLDDAPAAEGHPDDADIENLRQRIAELIAHGLERV